MKFEQRRTITPEPGPTTGPWSAGAMNAVTPDESPQVDVPAPRPGDLYVTVDERVGGVVGLVAAPWPSLDASGLRFDGPVTTHWADEPDLQARVDRMRDAAGELRRPLRVGDSFWVRGDLPPESWEELRDVTGAARVMARSVAAVVAVGAIRDDPGLEAALRVDTVVADAAGPDEPPSSGAATASPAL